MNDAERDKKIEEMHDAVIRMNEALIQAKVPERVSTLEKFHAQAKVVAGLFTGGHFLTWIKILTGNGK